VAGSTVKEINSSARFKPCSCYVGFVVDEHRVSKMDYKILNININLIIMFYELLTLYFSVI